ncbi:MAG: hypothetical protein AAF682_02015 [Planctomycetota bacterium]
MRKKVLLALALVPVWLLVGELVVRAAFRVRGEAYSATATRQEWSDVRDAMLSPMHGGGGGPGGEKLGKGQVTGVHPYFGWAAVSNQMRQINSDLDHYANGNFDRQFELLILGGSVAGLTSSKGGVTIQRRLHEDPELRKRQVVLLNHSHGSYKQPQMVMKLSYLLNLGYRPDAVLNIDGFNEVALGADNFALGSHPLFPHWARYGPVAGGLSRSEDQIRRFATVLGLQDELTREVDRALSWHLDKSAILGRWVGSRVASLRGRWTAVQDEITASVPKTKREGGASDQRDPAQGPEFVGTHVEAMDLIVDSWVESSLQIHALCEQRGIPYLHVLQPTLHDTGSKPLTEREVEIGHVKPTWKRGVELGYPRLREAGQRLLDAGVLFVDGSDTFAEFEDEAYFDGCHFRGPGMILFAQRIADELMKVL